MPSAQVDMRQTLTLEQVQETLNLLKGAVQIAYPAYHGLPTWDPVRQLLEEKDAIKGTEISEVN